LRVKVKLEQEATANSIQRERPDVVVVATGAEPIIPEIPGIANAKVVTAWDVLSKKVTVSGEQAVVIGGGTVGCETAEFLLASDNRVTIVEMLDAIANDMEMVHMIRFFKRLPALNIQVRTGCTLKEVTDEGVVVTDKEGKQETIEADRVVLALGAKPITYLADALEGKVPELHVIGDSTRPAKVIEAVYDGSRIARSI
jgi:pyruvate/2-oxoglutarate dehydrogenase complex dihydrolipoamide dehydrogenase (E3) component